MLIEDEVLGTLVETLVISGAIALDAAVGAALSDMADGEERSVEGKGERGRREGEDAREPVRE